MKIGFVNGCFDLFHKGHEYFLREALKGCDHLIVAVNSDASVRDLKGEGRPHDSWTLRVSNITAFLWSQEYYTGAVIPFGGNDVGLIQDIMPDVIFKGEEHRGVYPYAPIVYIPRLPGISTTRIAQERGLEGQEGQ